MKEKLTLRLDPDLRDEARQKGINFSDFLETKLIEEIKGMSFQEMRIVNRFFKPYGYDLTTKVPTSQGVYVLKAWAKLAMIPEEDPEVLVSILTDDQIDKKKLLTFVKTMRTTVSL